MAALAGGDDFNKLCYELEKQELEAPGGIATAQVYGQLLALFLLQNDLCNAKYLWKRIPQSVKTSGSELTQIWNVGQQMWQRDYPGVYAALNQEWSDNIKSVMTALQEVTRNRALNLIAQAYTSISMDDFAVFLGIPQDQAATTATEKGWAVDDGAKMILPQKPDTPSTCIKPSEEQLAKLTEFVSFLEN